LRVNSNGKNPDPKEIEMAEDTPVACSLEASALESRLGAIARAGAEGLLSKRTEGDRRLLRFRDTEAMRRQLEEIVSAEAKCCSFLDLSLKEDGNELVLSIAAPQNAREIADELAEAFTRAAP
jgi:hypothetical protein